MAGSIFTALSSSSNTSGQFGYVLSVATDGLSSVSAAKRIISGNAGGGLGTTAISSNYGVSSNTDSTYGFFDNSGLVESGYLAQVSFHPYGAFVISQETDEGKKCAIVDVDCGNKQIMDGIDITGQINFLANVNPPDFQKYGEITNFVYGIGVDIDNFVVPFFEKYFPTVKWNDGEIISKLKTLISQRQLLAKITVGQISIICPVTLEIKQHPDEPWVVFVPVHILTQTEFNNNVSVVVQIDDKSVVVGGGDVNSYFSSSGYDQQTGVVGFGPKDVQTAIKDSNLAVQFVGCHFGQKIFTADLTTDDGLVPLDDEEISEIDNTYFYSNGSVRFFFKTEKRNEIEETFGIKDDALFSDDVISDVKYNAGSISTKGLSVLVDVGHVAEGPNYPEYQYNKKVADCIIKILQQNGINCELVEKNLGAAARYAASKAGEHTCAVSIHFNAGNPDAKGTEVLFKSSNKSDSKAGHPKSENLAFIVGNIIKEIRKSPRTPAYHQPHVYSDGSIHDGYLNTIGAALPAILIECAFMTNEQDMTILQENNLIDFCTGVVNGITAWYSTLQS